MSVPDQILQKTRVLYVEGPPASREFVLDVLATDHSFHAIEVASRQEFESQLAEGGLDVVLADSGRLDFDGLQVIDFVHAQRPDLPVVILAETGSIEGAVEAIKRGASDYLITTSPAIRGLPARIRSVLEEASVGKKSVETMWDTEQRFRQLVETMTDGLGVQDENGIVTYANGRLSEMLGHSREEIVGRVVTDFLDEANLAILSEEMNRRRNGATEPYEISLTAKDGRQVSTRMSPAPILDDRGNFRGAFAVITDVGERKRAEEELRKSKERFQSLFDNAPLGYQSLDESGNFIEVNETWCRTLGYTKEEVLGRNFSQFIHPDFKEHFERNFPNFKKIGHILGVEFEMIKKDGSEIIVSFDGRIGYDEDGSFRQTYCVLHDITDRKRAEEEIEHLARFPSENPSPVLRVGEAGTVLYANAAARPLLRELGSASDEAAPTEWRELTNEALRSRSDRQIDIEYNEKIISFILVPVVEASYVNWYGRDVTERRCAEDELRLQSAIAANMSEGVSLVRTRDGLIAYTNPKLDEMFGYARGELAGRHVSVLNDPTERSPEETASQFIRCLNKDGYWRGEVHNIKKDGTCFWCHASASCFDHRVYGKVAVTVQSDITDRKRSEAMLKESHRQLQVTLDELKETQEQIVRQARLSALGEMASGVAHDLNNSLTPILGFCDLLLGDATLSEKAHEHAQWVDRAARDAAATVARLREFYRPQHNVDDREPVSLKELIPEVIGLTRPKWSDDAHREGRTIQLDMEVDEVPPVFGNATEIREVLANRVFNAADALPSGGRIVLRVRGTPDAVLVEVADTGIGMPEEVRMKCVEPFFTTKGSKGTGLGLSVCHGIVQRHGGRLEIDSSVGQGTTVRVCWPLASEEPSERPAKTEDVVLPKRRVLYIDDDARVRKVIAAMLEQLGQHVDVAEGGAKGLDMLQTNRYDLVITDLGMPDVDGTVVTDTVRSTYPELPVVLLTGWGVDYQTVIKRGCATPDRVLGKPVTIHRLQEVLEQVLRIP